MLSIMLSKKVHVREHTVVRPNDQAGVLRGLRPRYCEVCRPPVAKADSLTRKKPHPVLVKNSRVNKKAR